MKPSRFSLPFLLALCAPLTGSPLGAAEVLCPADPDRELVIRNVLVVEDCFRTTWEGLCPPAVQPATRAAWTFGRLVEGIAGTTDPARLDRFVRDWLAHWEQDQTINGDEVPARIRIAEIIRAWELASGGEGAQLNMRRAPFRLLAIVARLDLRRQPSAGSPTAGEGRFVFGVLDGTGATLPFTVIFEYGLRAENCQDIKRWAQDFHSLGSIPFGPTYNAALQSITDLFATIGAHPSKPNRSALNQLRTNENALDSLWELREFRLQPVASGMAPLAQTTVAQTPRFELNFTDLLAKFINDNDAAILSNSHSVPLIFDGEPFLGGHSPNPFTTVWDGPGGPCSPQIDSPEARHVFSLNTCDGCHGRETSTGFLHVAPRQAGQQAALSSFMTGGLTGSHEVTDVCGRLHRFNDIRRRHRDLCRLLNTSCTELNSEPALLRAH